MDSRGREQAEQRRIGVADLTVDQITGVAAAGGEIRRHRHRCSLRQCCAALRIAPGNTGLVRGCNRDLRNRKAGGRGRIGRQHGRRDLDDIGHVGRCDCLILIGDGTKRIRRRSHLHVDSDGPAAIKSSEENRRQHRRYHSEFDRRHAPRRCGKAVMQAAKRHARRDIALGAKTPDVQPEQFRQRAKHAWNIRLSKTGCPLAL